MANIIL